MTRPSAYLELADELERTVRRSTPGTRLPSEHELAHRHAVSRITTRAALQELERRHLVERRRGAGTFVAHRVEYPISSAMPPSFTETLRYSGHDAAHVLHSVRLARPPAAIRADLDLGGDEKAVRVERSGVVDGTVATEHVSWLNGIDVTEVRESLGRNGSLFAALRDAGHAPVRLWSRAALDTMPTEVAAHLGLEGRPLGWFLESTNRCDRCGRVVERSASWLRADVFRVRFELGQPPSGRSEGAHR